MILVNNFNLLASTSRFNEKNAIAELWFALLICGDEYPIILRAQYQGLITVLTNLQAKAFISQMQRFLEKNPLFFNYILKIIPVDYTCETNDITINKVIQEHYQDFIENEDTFRIVLKRRNSDKIERKKFIELIARDIGNNVNLENPDKTIRIEILGNICGISFLKKNEYIKGATEISIS
jgi:tRNA(Ser,Leu) C12 N-acetylase TAN1